MDDPSGVEAALRRRLDGYLDAHDLAAVWFGQSASVAWLTGADTRVDRASEPGCAAVCYDGTDLTVLTSTVEGDRLAAEELPPAVTVETYPWHRYPLAEAVADRSPRPAAADFDVPGLDQVDATALRQPLTDAQVDRYRDLGATVAAAVEAVARDLDPKTTERAAAADLTARLAREGVDAPVVLVGGERRAQVYRHYTPTDEAVGGYALLSVTARRGGLHASCTRTVAFDPPEWLTERHDAAARVEVSALAATRRVGRAGGTAGDVFAAIREAYTAVGHEGAWREHHQGGAAGFAGREWVATPDSPATVELPMAYAWNPTVTGAKSEGTVQVTSAGFEPLTLSGDWPTREYRAVDADVTLDRPAVLER